MLLTRTELLSTESQGQDGASEGERTGLDAPRAPRRRDGGQEPEVGQALRTIYQDMVSEGIPPEMLELLGKLD